MDIVEEAFRELYPDRIPSYEAKIRYSGRFSSYNANILHRQNNLTIRMSKAWRGVDREIRKGLIQTLLLKLFGTRKAPKKTLAMDLYNIFLQNVHIGVEKDTFEPDIAESFDRMNERYLNGMVDRPNLVWGTASMRKLGSYEYGTDTISISTVLKDAPEELLDLVVYHEMLHKKFKFSTRNGRSYYHTPQFRKKEREFSDFDHWEDELKRFLRRRSRISWLPF
ncbi:MAG: M48 family metallopeptidase [DPANN group archaeon]|nr:M48 family metallopeptidase [DPANN group archaeon]